MNARLLRVLCVLALLPSTGCALVSPRHKGPLARFENSVVFAPTKYPAGNWNPPGVVLEDVWFTSADGTKLHGWYLPHTNRREVVLFAHGNAGNLSDRAELLRMLHDRHQLSVMAFDYRGYGRSEGSPDEQGVLDDARAARAWLAERAGIAEKDIVLMGRSLGGGVVVDLAANDGARALIVESSFTSLPDVATQHVSWMSPKLLMRNRFDSLSKIGNYHGPLLISHGDRDQLIPFSHGQQLFAAANEPKRFVTIPAGDHNDPQTAEYYRALDAFLGTLP